MATHQISCLGWNTLPDTSGNVYFEPWSIKGSSGLFAPGVWVFNDTSTDDKLHGTFVVPQNYVGTASFKLYWTSTVTTNNVVWQLVYRTIAGDDVAALDAGTAEESLTAVTDAHPTTGNFLLVVSLGNATAANFAAGEVVQWRLSRNGTSGSDTLVGAATVHGLEFVYADA